MARPHKFIIQNWIGVFGCLFGIVALSFIFTIHNDLVNDYYEEPEGQYINVFEQNLVRARRSENGPPNPRGRGGRMGRNRGPNRHQEQSQFAVNTSPGRYQEKDKFGNTGRGRRQERTEMYQPVERREPKNHRGNTNDDTKPTLILHVGPPKTGTTTLQDELLEVAPMLLEKDRVFYFPRGRTKKWDFWELSQMIVELSVLFKHKRSVKDSYNNYNEEVIPIDDAKFKSQVDFKRKFLKDKLQQEDLDSPVLTSFYEEMEHQHNEGNTVLISVEQFSYDELLFLLPFDDWDVRVVATYRRYYEWLTSKYFQEETGTARKKVTTFGDFYAKLEANKSQMPNENKEVMMRLHPTQFAIWKMKAIYPHTVIFNFNESRENILEDFICKIIPEAGHTCEHLVSIRDEKKKMHSRSSVRMDYQNLAKAAIGKYPPNTFFSDSMQLPTTAWEYIVKEVAPMHELKQVVGYIEAIQEKENLEFPMRCLSEEQEQELLKMSLEFEEYILPDWFNSPGVSDSHKEGFKNDVEKMKFCDVDIEKVLNDSRWNSFFVSTLAERSKEDREREILEDMNIPVKKYTSIPWALNNPKNMKPGRAKQLKDELRRLITFKTKTDARHLSGLA